MSAATSPRGPSEDDDPLAALYQYDRSQAARLREQAREGGLRFEAFLPSTLADWLLDLVGRGVFFDPSEAVFVLLGKARELAPHKDLQDELRRRQIRAALDDPRPGTPGKEAIARMCAEMERPRSEPASWQTDQEP
ncbi:CopG family transcriptional regulator [Acetobacter fallax]|uniref:CopG family transcriptional regulator n=1 Tax=Acetobacter fallax TaxID=1737473 RepID=A0ABX0KCM2_9PROT|nr:CopG family transcriptional regulator [Acetobacter fallax]NHO34192.1 CopG family transcriptional regulator [Acetobacter fallax]NHO37741.1 CopG family transcriptional regulator [Acetobacter fallax]